MNNIIKINLNKENNLTKYILAYDLLLCSLILQYLNNSQLLKLITIQNMYPKRNLQKK